MWSEGMQYRDCGWCGLKHAQMKVMVQNAQVASASAPQREYSIVSCPECGGITVIETVPNVPVEKGSEPSDPNAANTIQGMPENVERYYRDATRALRANIPDAAAVSLRRTLEAAAADNGADKGVLVKRIQRLIDEGHVTKSFGPVLHQIRQVGNVGAHAGDEMLDEGTVQRALRFTTALLRNLYEVPAELAAIEAESPASDEGA